jgi:hypothetical protein
VPAIPADTYEQAMIKIRRGILAHTNQAMSRLKLFQQLPQEDRGFDPWSKEIWKQAERCDWTGYDNKAAARDAILFQTSDNKLRKKIIAENLDFDQALAWGKTHEASGKKAELMENTTGTSSKEVRRLEEKLRRLKYKGPDKCQTCPRYHRPGQTCHGLNVNCFDCRKDGHFKGAPICEGAPDKETEKKKRKKQKKKYVKRVEESDESTETSEAESINRLTERIGAAKESSIKSTDQVHISVRPKQGNAKIGVKWTADSGVKRSLLSEKDWVTLKKKNPKMKLIKNNIIVKPYSTDYTVPVMGKAKVVLKCKEGMKVNATVYVVKGETESLLGKTDSEALGIITLNPRGKAPSPEPIQAITQMKKEEIKTDGIISGGLTQNQIDHAMEELAKKYKDTFTGLGLAKVPPIHIHMEKDVKPVTQKQRPVPVHMMDPLQKQLAEFVKAGVIEGPLGAEHATGWIHNVVLSRKKWDPNAIRLNLDTRQMNAGVKKMMFPIPMPDQLRHEFHGSDRFSILDMNHAFHQFAINKESEELFKFTTPFGICKYKRLVMGTPPASGECHAKMKEILQGLQGVAQIKDDILVHGRGQEHDERLQAVFERIRSYGLTLRREKCKRGQTSVIWFGHTFSKDGMSPDPSKVDRIKNWPEPEDKATVKSFLQTVQFVAPYMRVGEGQTYSDITAPLRKLMSLGTHFKWTKECKESFNQLKDLLASDTILMNYDPKRETRLYVDHGPEGVAATVAQGYKVPGERKLQWRTLHQNGRALQPAEKNYGKIEGESLAIYSGIMMNKRYLYGTVFTVIIDHLSLVPLYNSPNRPAPMKVERHRSKLRQFTFSLEYEPGSTSPCDYGSRHPPEMDAHRKYSKEEKEDLGIEEEEEDTEIWINRVIQEVVPEAVTMDQIRDETAKDPVLLQLTKDVQRGRMSQETKSTKYGAVFEELTSTNGILLRTNLMRPTKVP